LTLGQQVVIGTYSQHRIDALDLNRTVIDEVTASSSESSPQRIRNVLGIFQFSGDDVFKEIRVLSGGEKARVSLAKILLSAANFLIMDEPTNHLDILSKEALERALQEYDGTLLLISHDRYFLTKLVRRIIEIRNRRLKSYEGDYNDYLDKRAAEKAAEESQNIPAGGRAAAGRSAAAGRKTREQRRDEAEARDGLNRRKKPVEIRIRKLEGQIEDLESRKTGLESRMADPQTYSQRALIGQLQQEYSAAEKELKGLYADWESAQEELEAVMRGRP